MDSDEKPTTSKYRHGHARGPKTWELMLYKVIRVLLLGFAKLWFRLDTRNKTNVPATGAFILAPVHRSNLDFLLVLASTNRRMRYLAKDSLWKGPWGALFTALGGIPVARGTADREALRTCIEVIEEGEPLVIFPEGSRQSGPKLSPLFEGPAFIQSRTGVPILPVGIGGSEAAMPVGSKMIKPHKVVVEIGEALPAAETTSPKERRNAVRARTAELVPILQELFDRTQVSARTPNP